MTRINTKKLSREEREDMRRLFGFVSNFVLHETCFEFNLNLAVFWPVPIRLLLATACFCFEFWAFEFKICFGFQVSRFRFSDLLW